MGSIKIKDIKIGKRYRKDMGDINELANSIKEQGLLQPVGINDNNELIFGQRRIEAAISLGWEEIEVRRVNVTSILEGELTENEVRKQFNIEERVAIGKAVEDLLGERRGGDRKSEQVKNQSAEFWTGIKTRDIVAQKAGFGSHDTYAKAKTITEKATPEQLKKVNSGESSINAIYKEIKNKAKKGSYIYFIGNGLNKVKIGWSEFPENRMEELQTGSSEKLIMLGYISGTQRDERRLHKLFKKDHYRGEWFYLSANIINFIKNKTKEKESKK